MRTTVSVARETSSRPGQQFGSSPIENYARIRTTIDARRPRRNIHVADLSETAGSDDVATVMGSNPRVSPRRDSPGQGTSADAPSVPSYISSVMATASQTSLSVGNLYHILGALRSRQDELSHAIETFAPVAPLAEEDMLARLRPADVSDVEWSSASSPLSSSVLSQIEFLASPLPRIQTTVERDGGHQDAVASSIPSGPGDNLPFIPLEKCIVCFDGPVNATFVHGATGHTVCCLRCARRFACDGMSCPVCRQTFTSVIQNFGA
eukprot:TRINITY_DN35518_c0_g1_i1.p1 TRINITY_DN35518_c0_g1~~TRINITY_DN35518_c0_g1_i1.p1  ORF type:complete len:265 (-),score=20.48 TRINITY_DN35518_c0_g1_i1:49-843(-)